MKIKKCLPSNITLIDITPGMRPENQWTVKSV